MSRLARGTHDECNPDTRGYGLDIIDWDELNLEIDDLCAAFKAVQPNVLPIYPSKALPDLVR